MLLPIFAKTKKQQNSNEGWWVSRSGRGNWGRPGATQQHRQPLADPPSPDSADPKISAFSNVTFTSLSSSTVRTLDRRTSWAPRRNSRKASAPPFKEPPLLSTPSFWEWVVLSTTITRWSLFKELGLNSQSAVKIASKFHVHSVNYADKLVHTRRALSSTFIKSHQEKVSGKACNSPDPHCSFSYSMVEDFDGTRYQSDSPFP